MKIEFDSQADAAYLELIEPVRRIRRLRQSASFGIAR